MVTREIPNEVRDRRHARGEVVPDELPEAERGHDDVREEGRDADIDDESGYRDRDEGGDLARPLLDRLVLEDPEAVPEIAVHECGEEGSRFKEDKFGTFFDRRHGDERVEDREVDAGV